MNIEHSPWLFIISYYCTAETRGGRFPGPELKRDFGLGLGLEAPDNLIVFLSIRTTLIIVDTKFREIDIGKISNEKKKKMNMKRKRKGDIDLLEKGEVKYMYHM